jgi:hypothetical protein
MLSYQRLCNCLKLYSTNSPKGKCNGIVELSSSDSVLSCSPHKCTFYKFSRNQRRRVVYWSSFLEVRKYIELVSVFFYHSVTRFPVLNTMTLNVSKKQRKIVYIHIFRLSGRSFFRLLSRILLSITSILKGKLAVRELPEICHPDSLFVSSHSD